MNVIFYLFFYVNVFTGIRDLLIVMVQKEGFMKVSGRSASVYIGTISSEIKLTRSTRLGCKELINHASLVFNFSETLGLTQ